MTPAKKPTAQADSGEKKKEYKYQQEISQMVGSQTRSIMADSPNHPFYRCSFSVRSKNHSRTLSTLWRTSSEVNLSSLCAPLYIHAIQLLKSRFRLSRLVPWQTEGMRGIYLLKISSSLYGTTEPKLTDYGPTSRGRRSGSMPRILTRTEEQELK